MSEAARTSIFVGVALVLGVGAFFSQPKLEQHSAPDIVGQDLFAKFDDPSKASRLEIVRYDEDLGEIHTFEVARNKTTGVWSIPSHSDYPADAEEQMRDAALSLVGLKVLGLVTEDRTEHELFGVVEPDKDALKLGDKGVGLLVRFEDDKGKELAELVIGKPVKGAEQQRFVRIPGQDAIYDVAIDPEKLSTKFEDWIEEDLLQLNTFDVERLTLKDYSLVPTSGSGLLPEKRFDATVSYDTTDAEWELDELVSYRRKEGSLSSFDAVPAELLQHEELNSTNLNDLKNALDDLKIVDVRRKPKGLGADLTAEEEMLQDQETLNSMIPLGFYPVKGSGGQPELLSANGEVHVLMKQGYEYVLRFGNVLTTVGSSQEGSLNRYMFVTTRVDYDKFPEPELEDLPPAPAKAAPQDGAAGDAQTDPQADQGDQGETPGNDADAAATDTEAEAAAPETEAADAEAADAEAADDEQTPADESASAEADETLDQEEAERRRVAERERITRENQRKMDEWNEKKRTAEEKVRELNARFADWYYVISEDVYKQIHLSRSELIMESEQAKEEGFGVDAFRDLQQEGLEKEPEPEPSSGTGL